MYSKWLLITICVITILCKNGVLGTNFQDCLQKDSISCMQKQMYNEIKSLVNNSTIAVFNGLIKIKMKHDVKKSPLQINNEKSFENAINVANRQKAFETYLLETVKNLWKERSITWNLTETSKIVLGVIPNSLTNQLSTFLSRGRGKKKRMKMIMPIIIGVKFLILILASVAYVVIALVAKKAVLAGILSLVLSGIYSASNLLNTQSSVHGAEIMGYQTATDWEPSSMYNYDQDLLGSYSEPAPQHQLFTGHQTG
ncbi:hypothetical protein RN001_011978 [Aquatica leii]|uniref:Uncharacterized protein n=1 Tax=Aquatica leii TaxID=1421715 RepID=A0AAN7P6N6_9COLE|nr:hypothetical protein RN001_011978 [Aquatica leii]